MKSFMIVAFLFSAPVFAGTIKSEIGIQDSDRIMSTDGKAVSIPKDALESYSKMDAEGQHTIIYVRNGKAQTVNYEVKAGKVKVIK